MLAVVLMELQDEKGYRYRGQAKAPAHSEGCTEEKILTLARLLLLSAARSVAAFLFLDSESIVLLVTKKANCGSALI
jgi:hypothetical protein